MSRPHFCGIAVLLILCAITSTQTAAQRVIAVQTPQFHRDYLWYSCNFMEYRPDQSEDPSLAAVEAKVSSNQKSTGNQKISDKNILNLVNSSNRAFEGISQKLLKPMERFRAYRFNFSASRDTTYRFQDKIVSSVTKKPLKLYVFGSNGNCGIGELLAPPFEIIQTKWEKYQMNLRATKEWTHIVIYAAHDISDTSLELANQSYVMISQHGLLEETNSRSGKRAKDLYDPGVFKINSYSTLSFGGILMMYEITPKSITVFNKEGEIMVSDTLRKDLDRNQKLDSILEKFRGIDFLFLVMKDKKYSKKRLNTISYLKTKYPEILAQSKVMKYSTLISIRKNKSLLKDLYRLEDDAGDLLIVEKVREFVKK